MEEMDNAEPTTSRHVIWSGSYRQCWNFASQKDVDRFIALVERHPKLRSRISEERLLPEWEKLEPVTGISAKEMALKWKRLCDKYRSELRREMNTPPDQFKPRWVHFEQMSFARETEQKRIRMYKAIQKLPPVVPIVKVEPKSPPNSPTPAARPTSPEPFVFKKPMMIRRVDSQAPPSCSIVKPASVIKEMQGRKLIPIEQMPSTGRVKVVSSTKQTIQENLQEQAKRTVANFRPVHRVPITDSLVRQAPDNDYDFLMIRIYPLLSLFPEDMKRFCYERVQDYVVRMSDAIDLVKRRTKRTMN